MFIKNWLEENKLDIGTCVSIIGFIDYYNSRFEIKIDSIRIVESINEEFLSYQ